jgi:3',5'-cyclic AMP phosphodiesterase CpdA
VKPIITRRSMLQAASAAGAGLLLGDKLQAQPAAEKPLRFVHLTDMHVYEQRRSAEGFAACLAAVNALNPAPDFMITGGDHVMESLASTRKQVLDQWSIYKKVLAAGTKLRVYPAIGNHDIWGWESPDRTVEKDMRFGKAMGLDQLELKRSYYSFDAGNWHFIILDSMIRKEPHYFASLDPAQLEWLKGDLAAKPKDRPTCVISHIPVLAVCVFFFGPNRLQADRWQVRDSLLHRDSAQLMALFRQHNVKLLLSGHIHLYDQVLYNGLHFVCDGAVSAKWWLGPHHDTREGFGVFDLHPDGRFTHTYKTFDWKV